MTYKHEYREWMRIARLWDHPIERVYIGANNDRPIPVVPVVGCSLWQGGISTGICDCLTSYLLRRQMKKRLERFRPSVYVNGLWWFPLTLEGAKQRAALCRKLARETR